MQQMKRAEIGSLQMEELVPLRNALEELMCFVQKWQYGGIPYFYHYLDYMKNNIEICICTLEDIEQDLVQLETILRRDWTAANDADTGIPSCILFGDSQREQVLQYLELLGEVGQYFL